MTGMFLLKKSQSSAVILPPFAVELGEAGVHPRGDRMFCSRPYDRSWDWQDWQLLCRVQAAVSVE